MDVQGNEIAAAYERSLRLIRDRRDRCVIAADPDFGTPGPLPRSDGLAPCEIPAACGRSLRFIRDRCCSTVIAADPD